MKATDTARAHKKKLFLFVVILNDCLLLSDCFQCWHENVRKFCKKLQFFKLISNFQRSFFNLTLGSFLISFFKHICSFLSIIINVWINSWDILVCRFLQKSSYKQSRGLSRKRRRWRMEIIGFEVSICVAQSLWIINLLRSLLLHTHSSFFKDLI